MSNDSAFPVVKSDEIVGKALENASLARHTHSFYLSIPWTIFGSITCCISVISQCPWPQPTSNMLEQGCIPQRETIKRRKSAFHHVKRISERYSSECKRPSILRRSCNFLLFHQRMNRPSGAKEAV